jgi:gluconokinase
VTGRIPPREQPVVATAAGPAGTPVIVGVDLGTTSAKAVAVDGQLRVWASAAAGYTLHSPHPGWAEQDPDEVAGAAHRAMTEVLAAARDAGAVVQAVSLSAAMHSLLAVDEADRPLTPALTYADSRATAQATQLRTSPEGLALYRRTGLPHHASAPLFKLAWLTAHDSQLAGRTQRWVSLKEHFLARLGAPPVVDHSIASGTGMLDVRRREWDDQALALAGVAPTQLSPLVPTTAVIEAAELDVPLVVGGGDGALANLGAGAVVPGTAALSVGTSGAVRVVTPEPVTDGGASLFCAVLDDTHWAVGGAITNGGLVLRWLRDQLFTTGTPATYEQLTAAAQTTPPGAQGLVFVPSLAGERAPEWDGHVGGSLHGLDLRHGAGHIVRAAMEGVALQLRRVVDAMAHAGVTIERIHATGGFTVSALWLQILADVLQREIVVPAESEGSSIGAVLLGMVALGAAANVDAAGLLVPVGDVVAPDAGLAAVYDQAYGEFVARSRR